MKTDRFHGGMAALPPTRWTMIARAGNRDATTWTDDLGAVAYLYRPVLVQHVISNLHVAPDRAEDLVQSFLHEKLLNQNVVRQASPAKGRFRSFLLKVFSNFVRDQLRQQQALKRGPSSPDVERLDDHPDLPASDPHAGDSFDVLWARQVLARTVERLREECRATHRPVLWDLFEARVLGPVFDSSAPMPYEELVARFGLRSPSEASNLLITAKRMFARTLYAIVRETVTDDRDVETEIRELKRILAR